jgi:hypothetical protein
MGVVSNDAGGSEKISLQVLYPHFLSEEALSRFFEMGLTTPEVASISGHRDPRMLFRYSHALRQRMLEVIDRHTS